MLAEIALLVINGQVRLSDVVERCGYEFAAAVYAETQKDPRPVRWVRRIR